MITVDLQIILFTFLILKENSLVGASFEFTYFCDGNINYAWCIPKTYDPSIDPITFYEETSIPLPWNYTFDFWVTEITSVDDKQNIITFLMYFRTEWYDPRIEINLNSSTCRDGVGNIKTEINIPLSTPIWFPDLEVYGLKTFGRKHVFKDMGYLRMKRNKNLLISYFSEISVTCQMDFDKFPLDRQTCNFLVSSFSHTNDTITCQSLLLNGGNLNNYPQRSLQYDITWEPNPLKKVMIFPSGTWEYCGFRIHLERIRTKYVAGAYAPSILSVILSWISFIIKPEAIPARIMLLLNIFLMLILLLNDIKSSAPVANKINAVDFYLAACIINVFAAIVEYAVILLIMKSFDLEPPTIPKRKGNGTLEGTCKYRTANVMPWKEETKETMETKKVSTNVTYSWINCFAVILYRGLDWACLIIFPLGFIIFNVWYWMHFTEA